MLRIQNLFFLSFCNNMKQKILWKIKPALKTHPDRPTCIDLFLTNGPHSFQNTMTIFTGLSDFHKMIILVFKSSFIKLKARETHYGDYKHFSTNSSRKGLTLSLDRIIKGFFWRHFHEIPQQKCANERGICQSKWGTLYG